jgi:hypothetical protein
MAMEGLVADSPRSKGSGRAALSSQGYDMVRKGGCERRCGTYRKSGPLTRINILVQMSIKASSLGEEDGVVIEQENNESHTDRADGSGSACVSKGASHRLHKDGSAGH